MWNPFKRKPLVEPEPGSIWWLESSVKTDNPFQRGIPKIQVIAVERGWVNYRMLPTGGMFQDESMKLDSFHYCYIPAPK